MEIAALIETARALGDLKENGDYHAAKDSQGKMESRIRQLERMLKTATVVDAAATSDGTVAHGSAVTLRYGYMERPNIPKGLMLCRALGLKFDIMNTSFFLSRRTVIPATQSAMPLWQDRLYIFMAKNGEDPTSFFHLPPGRVVELGTQVTI